MKRIALGIVFLVLSFTLFLSPILGETAKGPKMVLKEKAFDFKEVDEGKVVEHAFEVLNEGDAPLEIKKVQPD